ncbi:MAG: HAD-IA family hydrolase [Desulfovibrio sp.]|nr:HAD-IA family hydrolase [Desulfovibrio sp.]
MDCAVFDLDGTLLDTLADIASACNTVLAWHGYPQHPLEAYRQMVGNGFDRLVERAVPQDRKPDAGALAALTLETRQYYASHIMEFTRPYPGMPEALATLKDRGFRLGALSNKPDEMTRELIASFFPGVFAQVRGAMPDVPLKPDPQALLAMYAALGATRKAYVGDSNVDMQTAKNAQAYPVGVAWGFRGPAELAEAGAAVVLDSPAELASLVIPVG